MSARRPTLVLLVSHRADLTGAPLCLLDLVRGVDRGRFQPSVLLGEHGPLEDLLRNESEQRPFEWAVFDRKFRRGLMQPLVLADQLRRFSPDLVQVFAAVGFSKSIALAARLLRVPLVWHLHNDESLDKFRRRRPWVRMLSTCVVACSHSVARHYPPGKTRVIPNGVPPFPLPGLSIEEAEKRLDLEPAPFRFLFVGTIMPHKNVHRIVEAAEAVLKAEPDTDFVVVGGSEKADYLESVRTLIRKLRIERRFHLRAPTPDVSPYYAAADVLLLPSSTECFPRVILEAASAGVPSLATSVGDVALLIDKDRTGWLLEESELDPLPLAQRMLELRRIGRSTVQTIGASAQRSIAERFPLSRYLDQFQKLWAEMC